MYAKRIGAEFFLITERKYPEWPILFERLQIYELAERRDDDWSIHIDSDTLVHPECIDFTEHLPRDMVAHNGSDFANIRFDYDRFFRRDGRNIGSCHWLGIASSWCRELWKPPDDLTPEIAIAAIHPTVIEAAAGIMPEHLIDDYLISRNIARFGLKFTTLIQLLDGLGIGNSNFFWHEYVISEVEKVEHLAQRIKDWKLEGYLK